MFLEGAFDGGGEGLEDLCFDVFWGDVAGFCDGDEGSCGDVASAELVSGGVFAGELDADDVVWGVDEAAEGVLFEEAGVDEDG